MDETKIDYPQHILTSAEGEPHTCLCGKPFDPDDYGPSVQPVGVRIGPDGEGRASVTCGECALAAIGCPSTPVIVTTPTEGAS